MNAYTSPTISGPISYLPVELLVHIFTLSTHASSDSDDLPFAPESMAVPVVLSAVNRFWRTIVLHTPALWTNLCITASDAVEKGTKGGTTLDAAHLSSYLHLSRDASLDILIDARDPDWDYSETEVPDACCTYQHPFPSSLMDDALALLTPHVTRWRSLTILTDTYAPMYAALQRLGGPLSPLGSEPMRLETLSLMRCNEYAAHASQFTPAPFKDPGCFPFQGLFPRTPGGELAVPTESVLPNLRSVTLCGVHVNWQALPHLIPSSHGLDALNLSFHAEEVRPSAGEFRDVLRMCPELRSLTVRVSGPVFDEQHGNPDAAADKVPLSCLTDLTVAYRGALDACMMLNAIDAPYVRTLALEDGAHPADPVDTDARCLLAYCSTPNSQEKPATLARAPFPLVEHVVLDRVAAPGAYAAFFATHPHIRSLALSGASQHAAAALLPCAPDSACPCPELRELRIRGATHGLDGAVLEEGMRVRARHGARCATRVEVCEEAYDDVDMDVDCGMDEDPFAEGGAFNDPVFDAYYGASMVRQDIAV
ncbi:hypothetical protein PLICRDRAFT_116249 [Plicaturopsis crispa FD-325 SS-3]|nr:hypothetical protein PLICRDRAFT_116249 [Plicaturopsis crispa FD-325 SS-3]